MSTTSEKTPSTKSPKINRYSNSQHGENSNKGLSRKSFSRLPMTFSQSYIKAMKVKKDKEDGTL